MERNNSNTNSKVLANAIRALSIDAVQAANSGHPGMPMGMADIAEVLWRDFLNHNPANPYWFNRDRFVLSNGHGSMLLYSILHLSGYKLGIEDLKNFRQLHSKTPGHPELDLDCGIETTTGPLGQGIANAIGMAISEKVLSNQFNTKEHKIVDHYTYVFTGDGCLMEGISHEVCSLAGTLKLNKLIVFYDDNGISIDGSVDGWFTDNTPMRFNSYGWEVISNVDGHNREHISNAIEKAKKCDKPVLICCKTKIGFGSPNKEGKESSHGAPLGEDEVKKTKENLNWRYPSFEIPNDIYDAWNAENFGDELEKKWNEIFQSYEKQNPEKAKEFLRRVNKEEPGGFQKLSNEIVKEVNDKSESLATRKSSQNALNLFAPLFPELIGGSADLSASNLTQHSNSKDILNNQDGNYINYGVREFGMSAIMNGISLHGGFIPYGGTFLTFSDYSKNAIRMSCLMNLKNIFVFTHDSIGLGEDGPTHQAIEHINSLREIPKNTVIRPCDSLETSLAWKHALSKDVGTTCLILSRQTCEFIPRNSEQIAGISRGGYVILDDSNFEVIIIATGSEMGIAYEASKKLIEDGVKIRLVSMPSSSIFDSQDEDYKNSVIPKDFHKIVTVEAGSPNFWFKYTKAVGIPIGINTFGESAPGNSLLEFFGFTSQNIINNVKKILG